MRVPVIEFDGMTAPRRSIACSRTWIAAAEGG
jgi:hypothetical protein